MKLKILCDAAGILCPEEHYDCEIEDIATDSRKEMKNAMFVCLRGTQFDSHDYIQNAIQNGAVCVLIDRNHPALNVSSDVILLQCENTREALAYLWHAWYGFPCRYLKIISLFRRALISHGRGSVLAAHDLPPSP